MEEGFEVEYIKQLIESHQQGMMKMFEDAIREQRAKQSTAPSEGAVPSLKSKDEEAEWSDVNDEEDDKPTVTKTIELA